MITLIHCFTFIILGAVYVLTNPVITPAQVLWYGQASNIPMIILGNIMIMIYIFNCDIHLVIR